MFGSEKKTPLGWMAHLRAAPALTLAEAHALAAMETAAQSMLTLQALEEIKARLQVLDLHLERTVPDYRNRDDMRLLASGV